MTLAAWFSDADYSQGRRVRTVFGKLRNFISLQHLASACLQIAKSRNLLIVWRWRPATETFCHRPSVDRMPPNGVYRVRSLSSCPQVVGCRMSTSPPPDDEFYRPPPDYARAAVEQARAKVDREERIAPLRIRKKEWRGRTPLNRAP